MWACRRGFVFQGYTRGRGDGTCNEVACNSMPRRIEVRMILNIEYLRTPSHIRAKGGEQVIVRNTALLGELLHAPLRKIYVIVVSPFVEGVYLLPERDA